MKKFNALSISSKIAVATIISSFVGVVLMLSGVLFLEILTFQSTAIDKMEGNAKTVAIVLAPLVGTQQIISLEQNIKLLDGNEDLLAITIFDAEKFELLNYSPLQNTSKNPTETVKINLQLNYQEQWVGDVELIYKAPSLTSRLKSYYSIVIMSFIALTGMLLFLRYYFFKTLTLPLNILIEKIRSSWNPLDKNDLDVSENEIGFLSRAFEKMQSESESHQDALITVNTALKKRGEELELELEERIKAEKRLTFIARHDVLTGLPNRTVFDMRLEELLKDAQEENHTHVLLYMDLDQFKVVNDTCGHLAGDHLLRQISEILRQDIRKGDTLARLGGDEFGVLLPYCGVRRALGIADKLRQTVMDFRFTWQDKTFSIGMSIGLVPITPESESRESLLSLADSLCYTAKDNGRNCVEVYQGGSQGSTNRQTEMQWVSRITDAMEDNRMVLMYQPIQPLDGALEKEHYEILIRLQETTGELIAPGAFLPAAERYNLMPRLDRYVVKSTFKWLNDHRGHLENLEMCSINLSGNSLGDSAFLEYIIEQLNLYDIPAEKICFEITETMAVQTFSSTVGFMEKLKALGCKFALDDFGSGFSSYAYLKNLPVDFLKIDGAFVRDIVEDKLDRSMVKSINEIGHVMGKKTIAEYVENAEILSLLYEIGVDYAQGYYLGKPEPLDNILLGTKVK